MSLTGDSSRNGNRTEAGSIRVTTGSVAMPAIEKLKGRENYSTWAFAMRMILIREGSWSAVKPTEGEAVAEDVKLRALATICLSLESYNYSLVQDAEDAATAWKKLAEAFQDSGLTRKIGLLRKLTSIRLINCSSVEDYVNELMTTSHKLSTIGFKVDDSWLVALLLMGLPEYYEPMIMGLEASGAKLSSDSVKAKILQDVKLEKGPITSSDNGALYTRGTNPGKAKGPCKKTKAEKACFNCGKLGHFAAKCPDKMKQKPKGLCSIFAMGDVKSKAWYIDSGATCHMAQPNQRFIDEMAIEHDVGTANNGTMKAVARGTVALQRRDDSIDVRDVLKIPDLATNLLSVSTMCKRGHKVIFSADKCEVLDDDGGLVISGVEENGLYRVVEPERSFLSNGIELWHRRMGHLNEASLKQLKQSYEDVVFSNERLADCTTCSEGKQARLPFQRSETRISEVLELVHSDLCGPVEVPSLGGNRYFVTFVDEASKRVVVYFLQSKNQVFKAFKSFQAKAERQTGKKIKILRTDNGGEYLSDEFRRALEGDGIRHQKTCPYTPEQNGTAERMNRTLVEKARCLLNDARLRKEFWAEAVSTAAYLVNRSPARSIGGKTPEEVWTGRKPSLKHLRVFGSSVMVHVPKMKRKKFDPKAVNGVFIGYCEDTKGYRVYDPERNDFLISRDVMVISECVPKSVAVYGHDSKPVEFMELFTEEIVVPAERPDENAASSDEEEGLPNSSLNTSDDDFEDACNEPALPLQHTRPVEESQQGLRRSGRERIYPGKYDDFVSYSSFSGDDFLAQPCDPTTINVSMEDDPQSYDEVMRRPDRELWIRAMKEEITSLDQNQTWMLTDLPEGRKAIRNKWVFKTKRGPDGSVQRYKARLVVKGCSQTPGIDYEEVYSPVVRYATIRYLMALAVKFDFDVDQMDVVTAFLQGELGDEELYMVQPEGFEKVNGKVCRLKKALYGLKQSSRVWNGKLDAVLREFGLQRSRVDTCLYWILEGDDMLFVTIYVDDLLIFTNNRTLKRKLKQFLMKKFQMKDLGEATHCLGIRIARDRIKGHLSLDQEVYIQEIIQRFRMTDATPVATPADPSLRLDKSMAPKTAAEAAEMSRIPFKEAVGCLSFVAQTTRPDISYAVNAVSQFSANPGRQHWEATKRIIRYLKGTAHKKLLYTKDETGGLEGYSDADWGGDPDDRRSTTGYLFTMQGAAISWNVKKQPTVALSSCEAEFMALSRAIQEAMWWKNLRSELTDVEAMPIYCDNQSAISIANNGSYNPRTKHVSIRYHFVHESLDQQVVKLGYISTANQPADGFTKPMTIGKQAKLCQFLGIAD